MIPPIDKYGGWVSEESIEYYATFVEILFKRYGDKVKYWPINEQDHLFKISEMIGLNEDVTGIDYERKAHTANYHMCVATAKAINLCHRLIAGVKIALIINPMVALPADCKPQSYIAAMEYSELNTNYILDLHCRGEFSPIYRKCLEDRDIFPKTTEKDMQLMKDNPPDFIAINYYLNQTVASEETQKISLRGKGVFKSSEDGIYKLVENEYIKQTDWGWNICPEGIKIAIMDMYNRYHLPMIITENGLGAYDTLENDRIHDNYRIEYIKNHLAQIKDCIEMGFPVFGYCAWSFLDLVSGREGMDKRYGFVYVNRDNDSLKDLRRIKKDSYYWYKDVIARRGLNDE